MDTQRFLQNPGALRDDLKSIVLCEQSCPPAIARVTDGQKMPGDKTGAYSGSGVSLRRPPLILAVRKLDAEPTRGGLSDETPLRTVWIVSHCNTHENLLAKDAFEFCSSKLSWQRESIFKTFPPSVWCGVAIWRRNLIFTVVLGVPPPGVLGILQTSAFSA